MTVVTRDDITKQTPEKSLIDGKPSTGGRNSYGRVSIALPRRRGKQAYRIVDFKRDKCGIPAKVAAIEYDPNRSARHGAAALRRMARSATSSRRSAWKWAERCLPGPTADILIGNALPLKNIPAGTVVHNIELKPGKGAQMARSAGAQAQLVSKEGGIALLKLPSGEIRRVTLECMATIGQVGNVEHENESHGKAGKTRWLGKTPHNRGVTMNPVDHPHGGGEGKTSGGRHPVTPWGQPTRGFKTRNNKRTDKYIVSAQVEEIGRLADEPIVKKRAVHRRPPGEQGGSR